MYSYSHNTNPMNKNTMIVCMTLVIVTGIVVIYAIESNKKIMLARVGNEQLHILRTMPLQMAVVPKEEPQVGNPGRTIIGGFMPRREQTT